MSQIQENKTALAIGTYIMVNNDINTYKLIGYNYDRTKIMCFPYNNLNKPINSGSSKFR